MKNNLTGKRLASWQVARLEQLRVIRRNARRVARSGNPAKSVPAQRVLAQLPGVIRATLLGVRP